MTTQRTFANRGRWHCVYVSPATILNDDPLPLEDGNTPPSLREEASADGLCFLHVLRPAADGTLYACYAAAYPDALCQQDGLVFVTEDDLAAALPWDVRLQDKAPEEVVRLLHQHAAAHRPCVPRAQPAQALPEGQQAAAITVEVTTKDVQVALRTTLAQPAQAEDGTETREPHGLVTQQAFLSAALEELVGQLYQAREKARVQLLQARCGLLGWLQRVQRTTHERLVRAVPLLSGSRHVGWRLIIALPVMPLSLTPTLSAVGA